MRRSRVWINRIVLGLLVTSLIYLTLLTANAQNASILQLDGLISIMLQQAKWSLAVASIVGAATALVGRSPRSGGTVLFGTFLGMVSGGIIGWASFFILAQILFTDYSEAGIGAIILLPFTWLPGTIIGGILGGWNSVVLDNRKQR